MTSFQRFGIVSIVVKREQLKLIGVITICFCFNTSFRWEGISIFLFLIFEWNYAQLSCCFFSVSSVSVLKKEILFKHFTFSLSSIYKTSQNFLKWNANLNLKNARTQLTYRTLHLMTGRSSETNHSIYAAVDQWMVFCNAWMQISHYEHAAE